MEERKIKFEAWILTQFGKDKKLMLSKQNDAYVDELINSLWIGFNAGIESTSW